MRLMRASPRPCVGLLLGLGLGLAGMAAAHPLGNATVNRQAGITVTAQRVAVRYVLDLAEIPTLAASQEADTDQDGRTAGAEWTAYCQRWARDTLARLDVSLQGRPLKLRLEDRRWSLKPGAAGLRVLRLEARYGAPLVHPAARGVLEYRDRGEADGNGWSEVFIRGGSGVRRVDATVPAHDRSHGLTIFPAALLADYPKEFSARAELEWLPEAAPTLAAAAAPESAPMPSSPEPAPFAKSSSASLAVPEWHRARDMFSLGTHHIATGWDHLAFLFGLLLLETSLRRLIKVVTAFTLAHSTTLALAALGWMTPPGALVEPAIALSVAYVGLAGLLWRQNGHSPLLAFAFGLVHGFGFAGVLAATLGHANGGNPNWLLALASFNLGIEAYQLGLIVCVVPLLRWAARYAWSPYLRSGAALSIFGAGLSWFIARILLGSAV